MTIDTPRPKLLTVREVAQWLNISDGWVRDHSTGRRKPILPSIELGATIRFSETEVDEWLRQMRLQKTA